MIKKRTRRRNYPRRTYQVKDCYFCKGKVEPNYKETEVLEKFTTDRGKIIARNRSGLCQKHQRRLERAIKRARHLALLPFVLGI